MNGKIRLNIDIQKLKLNIDAAGLDWLASVLECELSNRLTLIINAFSVDEDCKFKINKDVLECDQIEITE